MLGCKELKVVFTLNASHIPWSHKFKIWHIENFLVDKMWAYHNTSPKHYTIPKWNKNKQANKVCPSMGLGPTYMATFVYHDSGGDFPVRYSKEVLLIYRFSQA